MSEELPYCECGCGGRVSKKGNKWILGHNVRSEHPRGMLGKVSTRKLERKLVTCKQCGKEFYVLPIFNRIFCSQNCHYKWRSSNNIISGENNGNWKGGKVRVLCDWCGKEIIKWESLLYGHNFCDMSCKGRWHTENMSGEKAPRWDGGISFDPYCEKFNEKKKKEVRNYYNNCDYLTGIHKDICNRGINLSVHHVDYNKLQGCDDYKWLLVPVSTRHNTMFNSNRPFWERLILYTLKYDQEYYD